MLYNPNKQKFIIFIALTVVTILCGLASRSSYVSLPVFVSDYAGDTLWAMMVFWCFCIVAPRAKTWIVSLAAIAFSYGIEFSQFYHAPWIESLRQTTLGGLIFGFGFKFSDLICYTTGILLAAIIHYILTKNQSQQPISPK
ncbi:MAG: DUF2809 domain-containing protein [Planctomycetes bacterium]|nr:DUF2809 domain-containing protein [Planctomycetota bacterium]